MLLSTNIKQYREEHYISQEYMAEKLAMCQPNYSRLEKNNRACTKRLPHLANALGTTPDILKNYHLIQNETGELEAASWFKALLNQKEQLIQEQAQHIQFQDRYLVYLYTVCSQYGLFLGQSPAELPAFDFLS